jgi:8-oxo-dGTP diphosphatase
MGGNGLSGGQEAPRVGCAVLLLKNGKVLLGKRNDGLGWCLPGGKLEYMEDPHSCSIREMQEETGINIDGRRLVSVSSDDVKGQHFITLGFIADKFSGEPRVLEPDKCSSWEWCNVKGLPDNTFDPSRKIIENYRNKTIYSEGEE